MWSRSNSRIRPMSPVFLGLVMAFSTACVTSTDVKLASTQMTAALEELEASAKTFKELYVAEIERTRREIGRAVVARAVRLHLERLAHLGSPNQGSGIHDLGLIALSQEIENEQNRARRLVAAVSGVVPEREAEASLEAFLAAQAEALRAAANLRRNENPASAADLDRRASELEEAGAMAEDRLTEAYMARLISLNATQKEVPQNLEQLESLIKVLQTSHAVIHDWLMTDVTISGEKIAEILNNNAATLGLDSPAAGVAP